MRKKLTWLHISDFHFKTGDPYDRDKVLHPLITAISSFRDEIQPDMIFVTGDVAHSGDPAEYQQATIFFEKLLSAANLERDRLFVIPGNHDVTASKASGLVRTLESETQSGDYFALGKQQPHIAKFAEFRRWCDRLFKGFRKYEPKTTCQPFIEVEIDGLKIGILCINSALFSIPDKRDHNQLWIGRRCLDNAMADLDQREADIRIALVHHPLEWLHDEEQANITSKLQRNFDFVLRGHLHKSDAVNCATPWGESLSIASGACYQTREYPNRCLFAEVDLETRHITLTPLILSG